MHDSSIFVQIIYSLRMKLNQITDTILMVRPANFGFNEETAANNAFQTNDTTRSTQSIREQAITEFDTFVKKLRAVGIQVVVAEDSPTPIKPDAIFPNNWVSFHQDGTLITYPMFAPSRRVERQENVMAAIENQFEIDRRIDFAHYESQNLFLEGTGSMIFDRPNRIVYACLSQRTDQELLDEFAQKMGMKTIAFHSVDGNHHPIYHTNVMMAVGETFVVICMDTIHDETEKKLLLDTFEATNKACIEISLDQMNSFAGNMLQVRSTDGTPYLVMSQQAYDSLSEEQVDTIETHTKILASPIPTIETYGGGSTRCMMAEVFLKSKS